MAMKEQQRSVYRTARGRELDMNKLVNQNELTIAVGNAKVNARGDKLGPNGQVIQRREEVQRENDAVIIPDQFSVQKPAPASKSNASVKTIKNVADMDPEGKE
jgi:hypothetical protein